MKEIFKTTEFSSIVILFYSFKYYFHIFGNLIFDTISTKGTVNEWVAGPSSKFFVYEVEYGKYLKVLVESNGEIITAFPSYTKT